MFAFVDQDDSYLDSYISTIGVDFVSVLIFRHDFVSMKNLVSSALGICRKYALWSWMGRLLSFRL